MSGTLPSWMEHWLGLPSAPGEGTVWSLSHTWRWPPWLTLLAAAAAAAFVVAIYLRENRQCSRRKRLTLAAVRLLLILLAALMIAQVALVLQRTGLPYAAVVVDDSLSMTVVDLAEPKQQAALEERVRKAGCLPDSYLTPGESPGTGSPLPLGEGQGVRAKLSTNRPHPNPLPKGEGISRWNLAQTLLCERNAALLRGIAGEYKLRLYYLTGPRGAEKNDPAALAEAIRHARPVGQETRLGEGVRAVLDDLRGAVPAAIVLLSDGVNTVGPPLAEAAATAQRRGVPLFCVGLGSETPRRDLVLSDLLVDDVVFVDDAVVFECKLTGVGYQGTKVAVTLRENGRSEVLARTEAAVGADDQPQPVRLIYRPTEVGTFEYVVEVEPPEGETRTDNNRQSRVVQVRKEEIRVLLAHAYPSFEYRYLRNLLARDETIALKTVLQEADLEHAAQDPLALRVFPERRDELFAFDVVILGDVDPQLLGAAALQNVADFVDQPGKGGALVVIAGPRWMPQAFHDTPLAGLLPFDLSRLRLPDPNQDLSQGFTVVPTELGLAMPPMQLGDSPAETQAIWRNLPPLYWQVEVSALKPAARVLAENTTWAPVGGNPLPVFVLQYVGAGKVLFHATDETWRWRRRVGDLYFARYWIQTLRWLCRAKLAEKGQTTVLSTGRREYVSGESVRIRVRFADQRQAPADDRGVQVVIEQPGRPTRRMTLRRTTVGHGTFEGLLSRPAPGSYHAWLAVPAVQGQAPAVDFTVAPPPGEFAHIRLDAPALRQAAKLSGGRCYDFAEAGRLLADLPPGRQVPVETLPPIPLWNRWPVLLLFLGLLTAEWLFRKRGGMV
ncbi:MAG: hypothetical protein JXB10_05775 [Pirellulales bacterium]|nr:hypothetical protein [Pirellulales bacterium]